MQESQNAEKDNFELDVVSVRLVKDAPIFSERPFNKPEAAVEVLGEIMSELDREVVCVINLRSDMKPINVHFASMGALNEAMVSPREILKASVLSNAASIMILHCHPSGNLYPSREDTMMTDRLNTICDWMGIPLVDHIIVGGDNRDYFSFREKQLIKQPSRTLAQDYKTFDMKSPLVAERGKAR